MKNQPTQTTQNQIGALHPFRAFFGKGGSRCHTLSVGSMRLCRPPARRLKIGFLVALVVVVFALVAGVTTLQSGGQYLKLPPSITRAPDANEQNDINQQKTQQQNFEAINVERKKQIADDSARLLKLAVDLKAEVDKTTKDTLSISVIRKADAIEKLAHEVKEKMKLTVGAN